MAVELRCPDCRAKLRLKSAPEPGTEVECPKCGTAFPAPEPEADEDAPKAKKKAGDDGGEKKAKKDKPKEAAKKDPQGPRKRKSKKRETSNIALIAVISLAVLMVLTLTGVLIWFFSRTPRAVEMLCYAPEDAQSASGMNIGHAQKYPELYKSFKSNIDGAPFKAAGDAVAKAGGTDFEGLVDQVVVADSVSGGTSIIFRTKSEFDGDSLAKIPGAARQSLDGKTFYLAPGLLPGGQRARVFSPTNRLVVVCGESMKEPVFRKVINGHADNRENTLGVRMGELGKRVTRGTFWALVLFDKELQIPTGPPPGKDQGGSDSEEAQFAKVVADGLNGAKGFGIKASLGSREMRFEIDVWYKDGEKASNFAKKMKESDLGKGDEGEPPRWFKSKTQSLGDKKIAAQILSNLGFGSSGSVFYVKTAVDTLDLKNSGGTVIGKVTGTEPKQGGGAGMPAQPGMPAPAPAQPGMPGAPPGMPPKMRRRNPPRGRR